MSQKTDLRLESFDELLAWLSPDRELAASIYEQIRRDLIKIFGWNGCTDPEGMADETFDRVAKKASVLKDTFEGNVKLFFYGVANNQIKEFRKTVKSHVPIGEVEVSISLPEESEEETAQQREECLRICLQKLTSHKRDLVLAYYAKEKRAKIDHRMKLAQQLGVSIGVLRVQIYRIRTSLEACLERCLDEQ